MLDIKRVVLLVLLILPMSWITRQSTAEQKAESIMSIHAEVSPISQIGGNANDIVLRENFAYVTFENRLAIIDITDSSMPTEVGVWTFESATQYRELTIQGEQLYLSTDKAFHIIDISNPIIPQTIQSYQVDKEFVDEMILEFPYLYVTIANTLATFDLSDINSPKLLKQFEFSTSFYKGVGFMRRSENLLFVDAGYGIRVIDISRPNDPIIVADWNGGDGMAITSNRMYTAAAACSSQCYGSVFIEEWDRETLAGPSFLSSTGFILSRNQISSLELVDFHLYTGTVDGVYRIMVEGDEFVSLDFLDMPLMRAGVGQGEYVYLVGDSGFYIFERPPTEKVYLPLIAR